VERGRKVTISATVSDLSGPISTATVKANTPSNGELVLSQTSPGAYSIDYQVLMNAPLGPWTIQVQANDNRGNAGTSNLVTASIVRSELIVDALAVYNSKGIPATDFSPGETIYPFFRIRYSSGDLLTAGQYRVSVRSPSGTTTANLTAVYDNSRFGFYAPTGFTISSVDPGGSWSVVIEASSIDDSFGNTGPSIATSVRVQVVTSPLGYIPFLVGGLVALLGGVVVLKRYQTTLAGFEHLEQMMGGQIPRASSLLLLGDPGSGKTVLSYQLLWEELEAGKQCALLSYDAFPEDVQARMQEFGWDIIPYLRKGRFKILDCYSGLTGEGQGAIRDPSDLTELNIQVTSYIAKAKGGAVTLILDSLTPIFNGVDPKQAINFIQTVGAKVKKTGGLFILTASNGAVPVDSVAKIKSIVDGVIELSLVRAGRHASRYLSVMKMERRKISPEDVPIEIDRRRGLVFRISRFRTIKGQLTKRFAFHPTEAEPKAKAIRGTGVPPTRDASAVTAGKGEKSSITPDPSTTHHAPSGLHRVGPQRRERDDS
jgi:KaiC/GvpD/RAD55 family RecA-like ATPase